LFEIRYFIHIPFFDIFIHTFHSRPKKRKSKKQEKELDVTVENKDTLTHGICSLIF